MAITSVNSAVAFIRSHSMDVFMTPEGLVIKSFAVWPVGVGFEYDDRCEEELEAFPIYDGMVSLSDIKAYLGY